MRLLGACGTAIREHKAVRRLLVLWAIVLITWSAGQIFADVSKITAPAAAAFATMAGLLTVVIGLYQWSRDKEDANK